MGLPGPCSSGRSRSNDDDFGGGVGPFQRRGVVLGEPNPRRFAVLNVYSAERHTIAFVHFPDCTTYEGKKLLVYKTEAFVRVLESGEMDPHFLEKGDCPIARFPPTKDGAEAAMALVRVLDREEP